MGSFSSVFLRSALGFSFLSAVADRFGLWGAFGEPYGHGDFRQAGVGGEISWLNRLHGAPLIKRVSSSDDLVLDADRPFASTDLTPKVRTRTTGCALPGGSGGSGWLRAAQCTAALRSSRSEPSP